MVQKKNNEVKEFMMMLLRCCYPLDAIFYADAINTQEELISFLNERHIDWMLCVKENAGNKQLRNTIKEYFENLIVNDCFYHQTTDKTGGGIEVKDYEIFTADKLALPENICCQLGTKMIARVTSSTTIYRRDDKKNGIEPKTSITTLYYISSLEYNDENSLQFVHSQNDRWLYESHHNTIVSLFKGNPLLALDYLFKFLETPPVES